MSDSRLAGLERTFMMEFPHPALLEVVNYANAFGWKTVYRRHRRLGRIPSMRAGVLVRPRFRVVPDAKRRSRHHHLPKNCSGNWPPTSRSDAICCRTPSKIGPRRAATRRSGEKRRKNHDRLFRPFDFVLVRLAAGRRSGEKTSRTGLSRSSATGMDQKIESLPNLVHLGKVEHSQLPAYAKHWDVAMIPFKPSRLSEAVDPIKIYEYIALGLPTVVTGMPHLASYPGVFTAETPRAVRGSRRSGRRASA